MKPEFSIIIPLYNRGDTIKRAILSVVNQYITDIEIIIIDGGSTDQGPDIVSSIHDSRIILKQQTGIGVANARNEGVFIAQSEMIAFLDSDDEWMPEYLTNIRVLKNRYPGAGIFATRYAIQTKSGIFTKSKCPTFPKSQREGIIPGYFLAAAISEPLATSAVALPKHIFYEGGGFPEGINYGEDMFLWGKIALKYEIAYSTYIGALYHIDADNRLTYLPSHYHDIYPLVSYLQNVLYHNQVPDDEKENILEYIASKEINRSYYYYIAGDFSEAKNISKKIKTKKFRFKLLKLKIALHTPILVFVILKKILPSYEDLLK